ncbi:glucokinase [Thiosulfatimonas sediminis]|uniref:Glucokinase n=1 Tax=Thiosulfatimonas sediminis TaxID=2675054 RepID=A0A6F8PXQ8_9GAMM|nr:glucokinase [Thiosulfatimonas sediminis]BBP46827.1 glucokinase [Thiosulfatimonas sediminis]
MAYILAGDIGGTKTVLAVYQTDGKQLIEVRKQTFASGTHLIFNDLLQEFTGTELVLSGAAFGIAGPIKNQKCITTNLPWTIDATEISELLGTQNVRLLNDLEAAAYGVLQLTDFHELNPDGVIQTGHIAVIAAGTGLGEAILFFDGVHHHAMPSEGGHCEFAPQNELEDQLLKFLRERFNGHVSMERILSGDGFGNLYDFLKSIHYAPVNPQLETQMAQTDRNALISQMGMNKEDVLCAKAMQLFCRIYGAEAGNLALKTLPLGGIYIAGGIAPKILPALQSGAFMEGFLDKGRMKHAIEKMPIRVVDNPEAPLLGAAYCAHKLLQQTYER